MIDALEWVAGADKLARLLLKPTNLLVSCHL